MSDLLSEFEELQASARPRACAFDRAREQLEPADQTKVDAALAEEYGHKLISRWFAQRNIDVTDYSIRRHRTGECGCARS